MVAPLSLDVVAGTFELLGGDRRTEISLFEQRVVD